MNIWVVTWQLNKLNNLFCKYPPKTQDVLQFYPNIPLSISQRKPVKKEITIAIADTTQHFLGKWVLPNHLKVSRVLY